MTPSFCAFSWRQVLPLVLLPVFGLVSVLWAQEEGAAPRIAFDRKTHDFGEVFQGGRRKTSFVFRNLGDAPLTIRKVKTTCGCTAVLMSSKQLAPGESGEIAVEFSSKDKIGYQDLRVYLYSNDGQENDFGRYVSALRLSAQVSSLWNVLPGAAYFGSAVRGQRLERRVQLLLTDARNPVFELLEVVSPRPWLEVSTRPLEADLTGGKPGLELTVVLTADAPVGLINEVIEVVTNHPDQPLVSVPVIATLTGEVVWSPLQIDYRTVNRGESKERTLVIERPDHQPLLEIVEVDITAAPGVEAEALLEVSVQEVIARRRVEVLVRVRADAPPGPFWALVRVFLRDADEPLVEVPVFGLVRGMVRVEPPAVVVETAASGDARYQVAVQRRDGARFRITGVEAPEGLTVMIPAVAGEITKWVLPIAIQPGVKPPTSGVLVLKTNVAGEERVEVPVRILAAANADR